VRSRKKFMAMRNEYTTHKENKTERINTTPKKENIGRRENGKIPEKGK
jgi:hypothetical protein